MTKQQRAETGPETSDDAVRAATGRGWDEWRSLLDAELPARADHAAIAAHVEREYGVPGWWAQSVTVGYERMTGRRVRNQRTDGSFAANASRTLMIDAEVLRERLLDDVSRRGLFPDEGDVELRSRPGSKAVRLGMVQGVAVLSIAATSDGRTKVTVQHDRLPSADSVTHWKAFWADWLDQLPDHLRGE